MIPAPRGTRRFLLLATTLVTILLWLFFAATERHPLFGAAPVRLVVEAAAIAATSLLFVICGGWLILSLAASRETGVPPTGLQRVLIYALLSFVAAFAALRHFDFDLGAVLTTSAIVTAAIGFAMQPMLGSMISGISLHVDRLPQVGDGILLDGQPVRIESMNWHRVVARRADGGLVIIPNARIADDKLEILPRGTPIRAEIFFQAPFSEPPQRIRNLVVEIVSDFVHVDTAQPIEVSPVGYGEHQTSLRYRIHFRARRYRDIAEIEAEVLVRLWYVFQRERLWRPADASGGTSGDGSAAWHAPTELGRLIRGLNLPWLAADAEVAALATGSEVLLFAPGERLMLPGWTAGRRFLLLAGEAVAAPEADGSYWGEDSLPGVTTHGLVPSVALHRVRDELAHHIGPYAEHAVRRAAHSARDLDEVFRELAMEIPDEAARSGFLARVLPERPPSFGPGLVLETYRNVAGNLVCKRPLRARGEVTILAMPPSFLVPGIG